MKNVLFKKRLFGQIKAVFVSLVQNKWLSAIQYLHEDKNNNAIEDELHNPKGKHQYELYKSSSTNNFDRSLYFYFNIHFIFI